jgi:NCS1 family nucleobase:cation symporter-1
VRTSRPGIFKGRIQRAVRRDPRIGTAPVIIFGAVVIMPAQLTTNMAANVVSPANDFSSLAPRHISYVTGGLITAVIGILMMPWKLYSDASAYIFTWLVGYSSLMGAIGGILMCDYWVRRRRELSLTDLFSIDGRYQYSSGINWRAIVVLVVVVLPVVSRRFPQRHGEGNISPLAVSISGKGASCNTRLALPSHSF